MEQQEERTNGNDIILGYCNYCKEVITVADVHVIREGKKYHRHCYNLVFYDTEE